MKPHTEIELKFQVPAASRAALAAEVSRRTKSLEHVSLAAAYLDTEDRRLARAGLAWRLRREGRRWIQTLKTGGATALERFEHDAIRPDATHDAQAHAGTVAGERLLAILREARHEGLEPVARYRTEVRRTVRRIRTRGAVVELAWDEGRLVAGGATQRIRELEFELVSGSPQAMLALADRWRRRFGLILDPRSKAERGDRLADGHPHPAVRKARRPDVLRRADARQAYVAVLDECLAQILRNTIGLIDGDPALRVEHVHQLRVGIRRLRSALRSFEGWVPDPPPALVEGLKVWFVALGACRDADVMSDGVAAELARAGAPPLPAPSGARGSDPAALCRADAIQALLLAWIGWQVEVSEPPHKPDAEANVDAAATTGDTTPAANQEADPADGVPDPDATQPAPAARAAVAAAVSSLSVPVPATGGPEGAASPDPMPDEASSGPTSDTPRTYRQHQTLPRPSASPSHAGAAQAPEPPFADRAARRLQRWHRRLADAWKHFDQLDEPGLHDLRKRIKRQRYAVEFYAPVLRTRPTDEYLKSLARLQERMGELNDLFVARDHYQQQLAGHPQAWFALGWLAARIVDVRALARPALRRLARTPVPRARSER